MRPSSGEEPWRRSGARTSITSRGRVVPHGLPDAGQDHAALLVVPVEVDHALDEEIRRSAPAATPVEEEAARRSEAAAVPDALRAQEGPRPRGEHSGGRTRGRLSLPLRRLPSRRSPPGSRAAGRRARRPRPRRCGGPEKPYAFAIPRETRRTVRPLHPERLKKMAAPSGSCAIHFRGVETPAIRVGAVPPVRTESERRPTGRGPDHRASLSGRNPVGAWCSVASERQVVAHRRQSAPKRPSRRPGCTARARPGLAAGDAPGPLARPSRRAVAGARAPAQGVWHLQGGGGVDGLRHPRAHDHAGQAGRGRRRSGVLMT